MKNLIYPFCLLVGFCFLTTSCSKDDPEVVNEEELITTLNLVLTSAIGGESITMKFSDLDGDGGSEPTITGGTLQANTEYSSTVELLNESVTPTENITDEVLEEAVDHQFFYQSNVTGVVFEYDDQDSDGNPIGVKAKITTGDAGMGNLTITLRHEPMKSAANVSTGDITNAGGESDIEVTFPIDVQ